MTTKRGIPENEEEAIEAHNMLALYLDKGLKEEEFVDLKNLFRRCPIPPRQLQNIKTMADLFQQLENDKKISVGNYKLFTVKLEKIHPELATEVQGREKRIQDILNGGPLPAKQQRTGNEIRQLASDIHPDLVPMIEKTKTMVKEETNGKRFFPTKAFHDAQDHLQTNRVLVIKGNTGDGKTSTAIQLLHWLIEEQPSRQLLQLHDIKDLKLITPNSNLVTFIDDIFGEKDVGRMDVQEWNKRITDLKTLFVNEQIHGNCLLITIRNEIFNALAKCSLGAVFTKANIIDLSLDKYKTKNEKQKLLEMYEPDKFSWEDDEKRKILACSPDIGFPQCCQLFCNSVELQKRRVDFFENPFQFFVEALSKLPECPAILFLFLNDGVIKVTDLDPNGDKVNKALLDEAFAINLVGFEDDRTTMTYKKKVGFVKDSLEKLSGYLVRKSKNTFCRDEVYRFDHHSIFVTVALLYGDKTRVGFIQNCPTDFLSYLTTSKTSSKSVAISSDQYTYLCERLLREFEREMWDYDESCIDALDVWKDRKFVVSLIRLFDERKVDRLTVLSNACYSGSKECVVQLLREGVKPDKDTPLWPMIIRGDVYIEGDVDILKAVVTYLNEEIKLDLFNKACESGSVECALYLLHEGVKPDRDTPWWSLITGGHHGRGDVDVLKNVMIYLNDQIKLHLLNEACGSGSEECVSCLLCEGVIPTKETLFPVLEYGLMNVLRKLLFYDVTPIARDIFNNSVLHEACRYGEEDLVNTLCNTYPYLVHDTNEWGETPLQVAKTRGNISIIHKVERTESFMRSSA